MALRDGGLNKSVHPTLSGTTSDFVVLRQFWDGVEIVNRSSSEFLAYAENITPTVSSVPQDGAGLLAPGQSVLLKPCNQRGLGVAAVAPASPPIFIEIKGNGNAYSVIGV